MALPADNGGEGESREYGGDKRLVHVEAEN